MRCNRQADEPSARAMGKRRRKFPTGSAEDNSEEEDSEEVNERTPARETGWAFFFLFLLFQLGFHIVYCVWSGLVRVANSQRMRVRALSGVN
tara:strand:- start:207 stop:482 length:276 start_codon:yes stop_codon:yes gene_type:complete